MGKNSSQTDGLTDMEEQGLSKPWSAGHIDPQADFSWPEKTLTFLIFG